MSGPAYTLGLLGPVAVNTVNGSDGTTTGTGSVVLSNAPTLTGTLNTGPIVSTGDVTAAATGSFIFNGRTKMNTGADGNLILQNNSATDFGRLILGLASNLFPALKRSTTKVAFRLGDDSADCGITVGTVAASDNITMQTAAKGLVLKQGANGKCGTFVANGITPVSVGNTSIAITDTIIISLNTVGGTVGVQPHVATITAATGFTVVCTATDTSTYNYSIISNQP